jgi:hypothetical protein
VGRANVGPRGGLGRTGFFYFLFLFLSYFFIFCSFIFSPRFQSNSLLNACSTKSPTQQNKSMLRHDAKKIRAPLRFYFTMLTPLHMDTKQNTSSLFRQKKESKEKRV